MPTIYVSRIPSTPQIARAEPWKGPLYEVVLDDPWEYHEYNASELLRFIHSTKHNYACDGLVVEFHDGNRPSAAYTIQRPAPLSWEEVDFGYEIPPYMDGGCTTEDCSDGVWFYECKICFATSPEAKSEQLATFLAEQNGVLLEDGWVCKECARNLTPRPADGASPRR